MADIKIIPYPARRSGRMAGYWLQVNTGYILGSARTYDHACILKTRIESSVLMHELLSMLQSYPIQDTRSHVDLCICITHTLSGLYNIRGLMPCYRYKRR